VGVTPAVTGELARLIAPFREAPSASAALFDVDGTLAPIVADPGEATVPAETQEALRELAGRLALVGCVSGRPAAEARRLVGVEELTYAGNHGLELLPPGARDAELEAALGDQRDAAREFVAQAGRDTLSGASLRLEDKGPIQALHWREAADEDAAEEAARELAEQAQRVGLEPRWGRKVLELRPAVRIDKGTAVRRLLDRDDLTLGLFAGDDRTDIDAFRALRSLADAGELRAAVRIGIASDEAPEELEDETDALLASPSELVPLIRALAASPSSGPDADP
jgi:trehalose 6-phosphate phosphatase